MGNEPPPARRKDILVREEGLVLNLRTNVGPPLGMGILYRSCYPTGWHFKIREGTSNE